MNLWTYTVLPHTIHNKEKIEAAKSWGEGGGGGSHSLVAMECLI